MAAKGHSNGTSCINSHVGRLDNSGNAYRLCAISLICVLGKIYVGSLPCHVFSPGSPPLSAVGRTRYGFCRSTVYRTALPSASRHFRRCF